MENDSREYPLLLFLTEDQLVVLAKLTVLVSSQLVVRQAGLAISEGLENVARGRE